MAKILVIEDEDNLRFTVRRSLEMAGHSVEEAASAAEAHRSLGRHDFDLVLTDVNLGGKTGLDVVREFRAEGYDGAIVVMTGYSNVSDAVRAIRDGADDYVSKPLSLEGLGLQVSKWIEHRRLARRVELYERLEKVKGRAGELVGQSPRWLATLALADRLAALPLGESAAGPSALGPESGGAGLPCILITGETGVGKGALARYIHQRGAELARSGASSARASGGEGGVSDPPFVHVNCSAIPAALVEGELFGHEKGAFTDARDARTGLFEMADGGTIFLDEVGEMPLELQSKLLLVVEHGAFRRVGGGKERRVRVRVIAASNQDLNERAARGAFRRDLLYRLNAFVVKIPALREREGDALRIADAALERLTRRYARPPMRFNESARAAIAWHDWPGNVRELINAVQRAVMLGDEGSIDAADLGLASGAGGAATPFEFAPAGQEPETPARWRTQEARPAGAGTLAFDFENGPCRAEDVERELIMQALRHTHGNVSRAAKLIGMQRSSLRHRIDRYKLDAYVAEMANR